MGYDSAGGDLDANVHVKNLPPHADRLWMYSLFAPYGAINTVRCQRDAETDRCVGWGLVKFRLASDAQAAIKGVDRFKIDGRTLTVDLSHIGGKGGKKGGKGGGGGGYAPPQDGGYAPPEEGYVPEAYQPEPVAYGAEPEEVGEYAGEYTPYAEPA